MLLRVCAVDAVVDDELLEVAVDGLDVPVMVTRIDGEILVATSICPHEVVSLVDGYLEEGRVTCPGHAYEFDLRTGACGHDGQLQLRRYRVVIQGDDVWIDIMRAP